MNSSALRVTSLALLLVSAAGCGDSGGVPAGPSHSGTDEQAFTHVCQVTFRSESPLAGITVYPEVAPSVSHESSLGTFDVDGDSPRCRTSFDRIEPRDDYDNGSSIDSVALILSDFDGIAVPGDLATCAFLATAPVTPENFHTGFSAEGWDPREDWADHPTVRVSVVECIPAEDATTTTIPTTTLPACDDADCGEDSRCVDGACRPVEFGRIEIILESSDRPLGSLQVQLDYDYSALRFTRGAGSGACDPNPDLDMISANCNYLGEGCDASASLTFHHNELQLAYVSLTGFTAPTRMGTCDVYAEDLDSAIADLRIHIADSSDDDIQLTYSRVVVARLP
jgi:hypothetical protein